MKHVELINRIIEAEQKAQEIAGQARGKKLCLHDELRESANNIRKTYFARADHRIAEVRQREERQTAERLEALDAMHKIERERMEQTFALHRDEWVERLFPMIVER